MTTQLFSKISFVSKIADLMKATSDDDKPIPGYLYKDVSDITHSSLENCETCVGFLVERLQHESNHVKIKVLKLMKYIVKNGHPNFRLGLMKKSTIIQENTKHSGPPDPLHGDVPYKMVRKTAQAVLEQLFDCEVTPQKSSPGFSHVGIGPSTSGGKMEGFGNTPQFSNKSLGESLKDSLVSAALRLGEGGEDREREVLGSLEGSTGYTPPQPAFTQAPPAQTEVPMVEKAKPAPKHIPGKAGGGWDDSDDDDDDDDVTDDVITADDDVISSGNQSDVAHRLDNVSVSDFESEYGLVTSYLGKPGLVNSPLLKRQQLKEFLQECGSLNCDRVVDIVNTKLSQSGANEREIIRDLQLLETLTTSDLVSLEWIVSVCETSLVALVSSGHKAGSKARKLIRILEKLTSHSHILPLPGEQAMRDNET
ncbi:AP-4 complex accessory subunit Tepsin-like [Mya arenaria]|uniref:AP-4 complex accessory subunit Tepsin-like n=1 Tax=Mya arenaria TaxID=6604 RepID=UPI0022E801F3|nr:AP-4 complex accessory subunit Tepsin-like [Mya arenaria]